MKTREEIQKEIDLIYDLISKGRLNDVEFLRHITRLKALQWVINSR